MQKISKRGFIAFFILLTGLLGTFMVLVFFRPMLSSEKTADLYNAGPVLPVPTKKYVSPINIDYLRTFKFDSPLFTTEEELSPGINYRRYLISYKSETNKIYALLTVPTGEVPEGGFSAIVFNHGYIPPTQYSTTEKYVAYVDYLARNGFVVLKTDLRGHGDSEGIPSGSYFSSGYSIDAINALRTLQKYELVNPNKIGIWGHSMAGNLLLRAMLVEGDFKAGVIWGGAVYSYEDFAKYRISDNSYVRRPTPQDPPIDPTRETSSEVAKIREDAEDIDFNSEFWTGISLTKNLKYLNAPLQLHHAVNDATVNVGYSRDLAEELKKQDKTYEFFEYPGGGHNIESPYFEQAMDRTVEFFKLHLK